MSSDQASKRSIKKTKKLLRELFAFWIKWTGAGWWTIEIRYLNKKKELKKGVWKYKNGSVVLMKCFPDWRYVRATIWVNLPQCALCSREELESTVVHELIHIFLNELRSKKRGHEERVACTLASAFIWVRDQTMREEQIAHARRRIDK